MRPRGHRTGLGICVLLPMMAALLPWWLCWRVLNALSRHTRLFQGDIDRARAVAERHGLVSDARAWQARQRLIRMVDLADAALSGLRADRWMDCHMRIEGDAAPAGPCLFVGFHFGAGFWSLRHLRRAGHPVSFLSRPISLEEFAHAPACHAFERWRMWQVARAGGAPVIFVGGSRDRIRGAWDAGRSVLGMVDVPPPLARRRTRVSFLGREAAFPDGLVKLAEGAGVPIMAYLGYLDADGKRRLALKRLPNPSTDSLQALVGMLETAIRQDPAAWHLWAECPSFFSVGGEP